MIRSLYSSVFLYFLIMIICWGVTPDECTHAAQQTDDVRLPLQQLWLYCPFDGDTAATVGHGVIETRVQTWPHHSAITAPDESITRMAGEDELSYRQGIAGQALQLTPPTKQTRGHSLAYRLKHRAFPVDRGTLAFWYRPKQSLVKTKVMLMDLSWASFQLQINHESILAYATSSPRTLVKGDLAGFASNWPDRWHHIVLTWDGPNVSIFCNGKRVGSSDSVVPLTNMRNSWLTLGMLPPGGNRVLPVSWADGAMDELTLWRTALGAAQVRAWYDAAQSPDYPGVLEHFGQGAMLKLERRAFLRGEQATIGILPMRGAAHAKLVLEPRFETSRPTLTLADSLVGRRAVTLDTSHLRPGKYRLRITHPDSGTLSEATLVIRAERQPAFPLGLGSHFNLDEQTLQMYEDLHLSYLTSNGPSIPQISEQLDLAFAHGISLYPNLNIMALYTPQYESLRRPPYFVWKDGKYRFNPERTCDFAITALRADGDPTTSPVASGAASPFSPIARDLMFQRLDQVMDALGDHPGLWAMSFQDERAYIWKKNRNNDQTAVLVGDYSKFAIKHYQETTGHDTPAFPPHDAPGTVWPDDHPYLQWMRTIGLPSDFTNTGLCNLYRDLAQRVKHYRPDVLCINYSGGEFGYLDYVGDWQYPNIFAPKPWGLTFGHAYLDFIFDRHRARQKVDPPKPQLAHLGWWSGDLSDQPDWCAIDFRLNTATALAKGVKALHWFSAGQGPVQSRESGPFSHPGLRSEFGRWATFIHERGPMFAGLEARPYHHTAVLWSRTNRAGRIHHTRALGDHHIPFAGLRAAGLNPDLLADDDILAGKLGEYDALFLFDFDYTSETLWQEITRFAQREGKRVYVDAESALIPEQAIKLDASIRWDGGYSRDRMGRLIKQRDKDPRHITFAKTEAISAWCHFFRQHILPTLPDGQIRVDDTTGQITPHLLWAGDTPYLFLINTDLDSTHTARVSVQTNPRFALNLTTGDIERLGGAGDTAVIKRELIAGEWAAFALLSDRPTGVRVQTAHVNNTLTVRATVHGKHGSHIGAVLPMHVEVFAPESDQAAYSRRVATNAAGQLDTTFTLASLTDPAGSWHVRVTEAITGLKDISDVSVAFKN